MTATLEMQQDIARLTEAIQRFQAGGLAPDQFRAIRLLLGVYAQRQPGQFMMRIRIPWGGLSPEQLERLADVAETYAGGMGHVTTRQNMQCYGLALDQVPAALEALAEVGLSTREASGNTVRNITACHLAGVCRDEAFDVTPYAQAVTQYFLRHPLTQSLPRKVKIAFSGCGKDCGLVAIHDLGAIAQLRIAQGHQLPGFTMLVGGGLGSLPKAAKVLEEFLPVSELLPTVEAVLRIYDRLGDRERRTTARLKFLIERIGIEPFKALVHQERNALRTEGVSYPPIYPFVESPLADLREEPAGGTQHHPDFERWLAANVEPQRQPGYCAVVVSLPLGDMTSVQMRWLTQLARQYGGTIRATNGQDLVIRWVAKAQLAKFHTALVSVGLARPCAGRACDMTTCPGADTCPSGITSSRGLARALIQLFQNGGRPFTELSEIHIKVSGCPNACGQYHIGTIGLMGCVKHMPSSSAPGDPVSQDTVRQIPCYQIYVGGGVGSHGAAFGRPLLRLPAQRIPEAVTRLLAHYQRERQSDEGFGTFVERVGMAPLQALLEPLAGWPEYKDSPQGYVDWGASSTFRVEITPSEC